MTARSFIFILLLIISGVIIFFSSRPSKTIEAVVNNNTDKLEEKQKPSDYWEDKWSYPSTESQAENYKLAIDIAKKSINTRNGNKSGLNSNWRMEGPTNIGGRANCLLVDSRDTNTIYAGMTAGGIFKTTNGGGTWLPITDDFAYLSISDIIQDPLYPDTIFAATGDRNFGSWGRIGDGVKVSYDAGTTWQSSGLDNVGIVSKLLIDSTNRILWASVLGNPRIKNNQRGVYKSTDMGANWQRVHFINDSAGAIDMALDPFNPQILYVSYFNRRRTSTSSSASGNDGRIWQTKDGGNTWTMLTNGLPNFPVSRIGLATSFQTPGKIYATIVASNYNHEGLYKSLDTGRTWIKESTFGLPNSYTGGFGWYFGQIRVNPYNDDEVWLLGVNMYASTNGGNTFTQTVPDWSTYQVHADKHDLLFISSNSQLLATDGGLYKGNNAINNPTNWVDIDLIPNNQFYRIAINPHKNEVYAGGVQDNGTTEGNHTQADNWTRIFGGDGFQMIYDPTDSNIYYCESQNGNLYSFNQGSSFINYNFDDGVLGLRNWDMPFIMSRFNKNKLYCLTDRVFITTQGPYGSFTPLHTGILPALPIYLSNHTGSALCESKLDSNMLYAGTGNGKVWRIAANTGFQTDISAGLPNRYVTSLTTSSRDPGIVSVTHSGYLDFITTPHIHFSTDNGSTWTPINGDLPPFALNDVEILDNTKDSVLFVASDAGVYVTYNRGVNWNRIGGNMPMIPVNDIAIDYKANRLIAGTFARSLQSFDIDSIIKINTQNILDLGADISICLGDTLELGTGLNFNNYNWSTGETTPTIKVFNPGLVWLEVQTNNGILRDSINISIENLPSQLFLGNDISVCRGSSFNIELGSNIPNFDSYQWNTRNRTKTINVQAIGTYILRVENKCYNLVDTININYYPSIPAIIESNTTDTLNLLKFKNISTQSLSSRWLLDGTLISSLDSFNYQFNAPNTHTLILESIDFNSCITNDTLELEIKEPSYSYHIPNIFTPNGDKVNDLFAPYGEGIRNYNMSIYNKWGAKLIELKNIPWNGRNLNAQPMENGTYFYKIQLELNNYKKIDKAGMINLIR